MSRVHRDNRVSRDTRDPFLAVLLVFTFLLVAGALFVCTPISGFVVWFW